MAEQVQIRPTGPVVKRRNPWGVLGLSIITLGIYYWFYWYYINREMRDVGDAKGVDLGQSPATSVVALTIGAFIIVPPFVTIWNTGRRMEHTQRTLGVDNTGSGPLFFLLHLVPIVSLYAPVYLQQQLNRAWDAGGGPASAGQLPAYEPDAVAQPDETVEQPAEFAAQPAEAVEQPPSCPSPPSGSRPSLPRSPPRPSSSPPRRSSGPPTLRSRPPRRPISRATWRRRRSIPPRRRPPVADGFGGRAALGAQGSQAIPRVSVCERRAVPRALRRPRARHARRHRGTLRRCRGRGHRPACDMGTDAAPA